MTNIPNQFKADLKSSCILIVDDEPSNVKLLERVLSLQGYNNVVSTMDPSQALPLYMEHECDLILLDIDMPVMDGFGVMEQFHNEAKIEFPSILILTAQDMQSFRQRALDNGARDYVTKPFDSSELLSRVRNLLEVQKAHRYMLNQNAILENKVRERTEMLHGTRLQVVRRLGRAAEYRDNETGLHIIRMSNMAALIAKAAGMTDNECDLLLNAAPMHDIGKIGIPDDILLKPGKLDKDEWEIMKTHAQIGADILSGDDSDLLSMAREIALTHHEKWDGSGYPNGLKGKEIPLVGRITALADVFDALTSKRPYKEEWPVEKAVELIKEESEKHFDPELVGYFLDLLPGMVRLKETYSEPEEV